MITDACTDLLDTLAGPDARCKMSSTSSPEVDVSSVS